MPKTDLNSSLSLGQFPQPRYRRRSSLGDATIAGLGIPKAGMPASPALLLRGGGVRGGSVLLPPDEVSVVMATRKVG